MRDNSSSTAQFRTRRRLHRQSAARQSAYYQGSRRLGLAAVFDDPEQTITCGDSMLIANSNIRWLAVRDQPTWCNWRRTVLNATAARARLRFGMPHLCFAESPGVPPDVTRLPVSDAPAPDCGNRAKHEGGDLDELAVSQAAVLRHLIHAIRDLPPGTSQVDARALPSHWFPEACLGFSAGSASELFRLATCEQPVGRTLPCRGCGRDIDLNRLVEHESDRWGLLPCPLCRRKQRWPLDEAVPARFVRHVPIGFIRRFCRAMEDRFPLKATERCTYCGTRSPNPTRDWPNLPDARSRRLQLIVHEFHCHLTDQRRFVYLPASAIMEARAGQVLKPGQIWCRVLPAAPEPSWRSLPRQLQYTSADKLLGSDVWADHLKRTWFDCQGITCEELGEHQRLWPADLVAFAAGNSLRPLGLYWDFSPSRNHIDPELAAAVFPPVHLRPSHPLRMTMRGEVAFDASTGTRSHPVKKGPSVRQRKINSLPTTGTIMRLAS